MWVAGWRSVDFLHLLLLQTWSLLHDPSQLVVSLFHRWQIIDGTTGFPFASS